MDNVTFVEDELDSVEYAIIDRGNGEYTSMLKSTYDEQQANSGSSVPNDPLATADSVSPSSIVP